MALTFRKRTTHKRPVAGHGRAAIGMGRLFSKRAAELQA